MQLKKPFLNKDYADLAVYCNENNCHIEDKGDYLEAVENPPYVPTKEDIRAERQAHFIAEADPIKYDYEESLARGDASAEELKTAWLAKKDEIREALPYPEE